MKFALFLVLFTSTAHADGLLDGLTPLVNQGQHEGKKACDRFRKKWKGMVKGGLNRESPSHISKQQTMDVMALMEKYPGRPPSAAKAWRYIAENEDALEKEPDQKSVLTQMAQIEPACEQFSVVTHLSLLMKDIAVYSLPKKDAKRALKVVRHYLEDKDTDGEIASLGRKIGILKDFIDSVYTGDNRDALKTKAAALLTDLETSREAIKPEMLALSTAGKGETLAYWAPEIHLWKRLLTSYASLLGEVQF